MTPTAAVPDSRSSSSTPSATALALLAALAFAASLWALFQWGELLVARAGGVPFCAVGEGLDCAAVWDSDLAKQVHAVTRVPVAGWGLIWGVLAFALSLLALVAPHKAQERGLTTALLLTALGGVVTVGGLGTASLIAGALCLGCLGTYVLVFGFAGAAWASLRNHGFVQVPRALGTSAGIVVASWLVLLVPGMRTPSSAMDASRDALTKAASAATAGAAPTASPALSPGQKNPLFDGPATGDPQRDDTLTRFVSELDPQSRQMLADFLGAYAATPVKEVGVGRAVEGAGAGVSIVEWTDPLCGHCAGLHETLAEIKRVVPPGLFSTDARHFPLDGVCNPSVQRKWENDVRCQAAKALVCLEGDPRHFEAQGAVFANQQRLDPTTLFEVLAPFADKAKLQTCMALPATQEKLMEDIRRAETLGLEGTPLVMLNGREVPPMGPLLFALILSNGSFKHPAFSTLPAPKPLPDPHAGHAH